LTTLFLTLISYTHNGDDTPCHHVCSSLRMGQLGSQWTDFNGILYLSVFRKSVEEVQGSLISEKRNGYFSHAEQYTFLIISRSFLLRTRNSSNKSCRKIKTHVLFYFPRKSFRVWDNVEKCCRAGEAADDNI